MTEKRGRSERRKRVIEGREGVPYLRSSFGEDEPLFLHARPVSRLMNCIIGNPEYKLDSAITSSNR